MTHHHANVPLIPIAPTRGHRPRFGKKLRVKLSTACVDESTAKQLNTWMRASRKSRGLVLDEVVGFARGERFSPSKCSR